MGSTTANMKLPYPAPTDNSQTWNYWQQLAARLEVTSCPLNGRFTCDPFRPLTATAVQIPLTGKTANLEFPAGAFTFGTGGTAGDVIIPSFGAGIYTVTINPTFASSANIRGFNVLVNGTNAATITGVTGTQAWPTAQINAPAGAAIRITASSNASENMSAMNLVLTRAAPLNTA